MARRNAVASMSVIAANSGRFGDVMVPESRREGLQVGMEPGNADAPRTASEDRAAERVIASALRSTSDGRTADAKQPPACLAARDSRTSADGAFPDNPPKRRSAFKATNSEADQLKQPERYPDYLMPFVGIQLERDRRFAETVEAFLVNYGYNTARAYRTDLEDIYLWSQARDLDFFELTEKDLKQYVALMRRRKYSEGTIRRRMTAWRGVQYQSETDRTAERELE